MKEVTIKAYTRRSKSGKNISVKGYTRRVGRKGVKSPKREKASASPGEEFLNVKNGSSKYTGPKMTKEEFDAWEKSAREFSNVSAGRQRQLKDKKSLKYDAKKPVTTKKAKGILKRLEDKIADAVEKYSGKSYKRML